ncbi:MAG: M56 family metallopeptidase, partial [Phycisphaerae bacterium]
MPGLWEQSRWWVLWLVRSSLQASVLIVLVLAAQRLLRRWLSARWRDALWLLVLVRLTLPLAPGAPWSVHNLTGAMAARAWRAWGGGAVQKPSAPEGLGAFVAATAVYAAAVEDAAADAPEEQVRVAAPWWTTLCGALTLAWAAGAAALLLRLVVCNVRFHRRLRRLSRRPDCRAMALLGECSRQMGVRGRVDVLETEAARVPALFGLFRPKLLLPTGFAAAMGPDEFRHVLRHELAHLRRRDVPLDWLWAIMCAAHWFNPLIWLAARRMRNDRELACDEAVLARTPDCGARAYGRTILKLLTAPSRPARLAGVVAVTEGTRQARRRILMIASFRRSGRWGSVIGGALMLTLGAAALTNARCDSSESAMTMGVAGLGGALPPAPATLDEAALKAEKASELSTRVYDTRDLPATRPATAPARDREKAEERRLAEIVALVRRAAGEKAWKPDGPGAVTQHEGQLVITQTGAGHEKVAGALWELRRPARPQIHIDAKFLEAKPAVIDAVGATWQALLSLGGEPE